MLPGGGDAAKFSGDEAAEGRDLVVVEGDAEGLGDVVQRGEAGDAEAAAIGEGLDELRLGGFELVANFADEFLDEAFEGDDAGGGAEVVHDEGHVEFLAEEFLEGGFEWFGFGEAEDVALDLKEVKRGAGGGMAEEILDVDEAEAVVEIAVAEGEAGVAGAAGVLENELDVALEVASDDAIAGEEDVGELEVAEAKGVGDDGAEEAGDELVFLAHRAHLDLDVEEIEVLTDSDAHFVEDGLGDGAKEAAERITGSGEAEGDPGSDAQSAHRASEGEAARNEVAEQVEERERDDEGDGGEPRFEGGTGGARPVADDGMPDDNEGNTDAGGADFQTEAQAAGDLVGIVHEAGDAFFTTGSGEVGGVNEGVAELDEAELAGDEGAMQSDERKHGGERIGKDGPVGVHLKGEAVSDAGGLGRGLRGSGCCAGRRPR